MNEFIYLWSWHAFPFPGQCTWLSPPGFLNSLPKKPCLYVESMGATGQSVGKQTSGIRHFLKPSHLTVSLLQELHPFCGLPVGPKRPRSWGAGTSAFSLCSVDKMMLHKPLVWAKGYMCV